MGGAAGRRLVSPRLVGRAEELERVLGAVTVPPAVVVVEGEAGVGKTRLVTELETHSTVSDLRFMVGGCRRVRESFPLGPVLEALRGLGEEPAQMDLSPVAGALRPLLPEIAAWLPPHPGPLDDRAAERHRVFRALVEVIGAVGATVLVLEDLHWADEHTLDFVGYLLDDPPPKLSLLLTFRGDEADPRVRTLSVRLPLSVSAARVVLAPLEAPQVGELAAAILGLERVSDEFAAYLCERAAGVPFAIEELLALMRTQGALAHRGQGRWTRQALDELDVPAGIREPVLERFSRLDRDARAVVEAAAVLQTPVPATVLVATCLADETGAWQGLEEVLTSGLLTERGQQVGFRHLLAAQAVHESMPGPRRRRLHARAASALEVLDPVPLGQRAHHLQQAGQLPEWVEAAERAADHAVELGHDDEAVRLLEDVLGQAPLDVEQRGRVAVKLGRAADQVLGPVDGVVALLSDVTGHELPRLLRGELRLRLAVLLNRVEWDFVEARTMFAEAVEDLGERPDLQAQAMVGLGVPVVAGVPLVEYEQWLHRVLDLLPAIDDPGYQVFLLGKVAMVQVGVGDPGWQHLTDRIIGATGGTPRQHREANAYLSVGIEACYAGHLAIAERLLRAGLDGALACEHTQLERRVRAALAFLDYCRGAWDGLADTADVLLDQLTDYPPSRSTVETVAGCLALARGDLDRASQWLGTATESLAARRGIDLLTSPGSAMIRLSLGREDIAGAITRVRRLLDVMESVPFAPSAARALPAVTEALVAGGELDDAQALVTRWERELRGLDAPLAPAALPHAGGFLAAATGPPSAAARSFLAAADRYEQLGCPYEVGQVREWAGSLLVRAGEQKTGAAELHGALAIFNRLDASWDYARAARTARQHGLTVPVRRRSGRPSYGNELSPREQQVAELAAIGRTNKEIAAELFLSVYTIEQHVSAAMRKLGVRSRAAIRDRLTGVE